MKNILILILTLSALLYSCNKENDKVDYRDSVVGIYDGIRVDTRWIDTIVGFNHDTTPVAITLTKSKLDSIVDMDFNPPYHNEIFSFKLKDGVFTSTVCYHPPLLKVTNDSLYFKHQSGLGPIWTECFALKLLED